jgi:ribosomal protein S27E
MQQPLNKNEIIEKIAKRLKCSTCGRRYRPYDFTVMEEGEAFAVMKIVCRECRKQSVVFAIVQRKKVQPVFSELEPEEWNRFRHLPVVNRDDVVDIHRKMRQHAGDLSDVLEDPLPPEASEE